MNALAEQLQPSDGRLESWKEIAAHLDRDVRTVQRWEKGEGLPVHRHQHDKLGSVYAFSQELDAWREGRRTLPGPEPEAAPEPTPEAPPEGAAKGGKGRHRVLTYVLAAVAAASLAAYFLGVARKRLPLQGPTSVAVLPFANLSGDAAQDYFSDGVTEELITQLGRLQGQGPRIVALGSSLSYKHTPKAPRQIASELGVAYVMEGTVRRSGDQVRITVHLVRGRDETHVWDESYDCAFGDILALQSEVAGAIASNLSERIGPSPAQAGHKAKPEAMEAYLKGRYFWNQRTPGDLLRALECFQRAAALDGSFAPSHVGIADCYVLMGSAEMGTVAPNEAMPKARQEVLKALALDPGLAEAHATLAHIKLVYDWDMAGSEQSFRKAILLNPASVTAHQWFALYFNVIGRTDQALAEVRIAEQLDPLSPLVKTALAETYYLARRYPEAEAAGRSALAMDPGYLLGWVNLGRTLELEGRYDEAIAGMEKAWLASGKAPGLTMLLGHAYARKGDSAMARKMLQELQAPPQYQGRPLYVPSIYLAAVQSALGEKEAAVANLKKALEERCEYLVYLPHDPMADALRKDPGFASLLRAVRN